MKSLFFKIGDPISNLTELSTSVSSHANVETKNQSFQVIKTQEKSLFKEISTDLESKNKIIFNNLNKLQEEKKTLSEFFENIKKKI
ncbi:hypothetical protein NPA08_01440 [Mycoplasmopsis citelli]|uniref:hypothetical protein n=1 Tax=Mycoplasmopsis citelli TaxID=171281 RepID=UPI002113B94A|nr:hypothetical protein [Mycoplasmopsis citelli]UUD36480.1 hypothetical protein NPA08_01440 [Mycoplasmopsis citelli]